MDSSAPAGLFQSPPLARWLPGETVYSLASRFHWLSNNPRPGQTAAQLFGHDRGGFPHDLPSGLRHLAEAFEGSLGTAQTIAWDHTVLPFFFIFRAPSQRGIVLSAMASPRIGSLKMQLGLPASRLGARCVLKACRECIHADRREHGTAYWHRDHQYPGLWICPRHSAPLTFSLANRAGEYRFGWALPDEADLAPCLNLDMRDHAALQSLARLVLDAASSAAATASAQMSEAVLLRLNELDLATPGGRLRSEQVASAFDASLKPLRIAPDVASLFTSPGALYGQVLHALRSAHGGHALRPLLVVHWLFGSWTRLFEYCRRPHTPNASQGSASESETPDPSCARNQVTRMVAEHGFSVSAAAREAGVSIVTAQAWMASTGLRPKRRASKLTPPALSELIASLANGDDISCAAERAGVSTTSANRVLRTEVGLLGKRQAAIMERRRSDARQEWKAAVDSGIGTKLARVLAPAAYAWLYRNDTEWLEAAAPPRRGAPARRLDWEKRDMDLCTRVQAAALELCDREPPRHIKVVELLRAVPELKSKLDVLGKLPLTAKALATLAKARTPMSRHQLALRLR